MGMKAREYVLKNYTWDLVADEYEKTFLNLVGSTYS
jgi:glycosyltransferase involved in cell wall biosynthesis